MYTSAEDELILIDSKYILMIDEFFKSFIKQKFNFYFCLTNGTKLQNTKFEIIEENYK